MFPWLLRGDLAAIWGAERKFEWVETRREAGPYWWRTVRLTRSPVEPRAPPTAQPGHHPTSRPRPQVLGHIIYIRTFTGDRRHQTPTTSISIWNAEHHYRVIYIFMYFIHIYILKYKFDLIQLKMYYILMLIYKLFSFGIISSGFSVYHLYKYTYIYIYIYIGIYIEVKSPLLAF